MEPSTFWLVVLVLAAIVAVAVAYAVWRGRHRVDRDELRRYFGPEYERAVEQYGSGKAARRELRRRMKHVSRLRIHELSREDYERFAQSWDMVQTRFVDDPPGAVRESHALVEEVMHARGYPVNDFDDQVRNLSVHHGNVVQHYRAARALARGVEDGSASTEDLRQALVHYRELFGDLLQREPAPDAQARRELYA